MIISFSVLIGFLCGIIYYRKFLLLKIFFIVLFFSKYILNLYFYIKKNNNGKMHKIDSKRLNSYFIDKYHLTENNKDFTIMFMSKDKKILNDKVEDFKNNIEDNLMNKDLIVHCNISYEDDLVIELTDIIRKFCYYFDKEYELDMFLEYVDNYIVESKPNTKYVNIYNYNLCVYLNDNNFTEKKIPIKDIINSKHTFKKLICM